MTYQELSRKTETPLKFARISFDIDGVLAEIVEPALTIVNQRHGTNYRYEDYNYWGWIEDILRNRHGYSQEDIRLLWACPEVVLSGTPYPGSVEAIQELIRQGAQVSFSTARSPEARETTFKWFRTYYPFIKENQINIRQVRGEGGPAFKKAAICAFKPDLHIEDSPDFANSLEVPVLLVTRNWNRSVPTPLIRREDWSGIYRYIVVGQ